jgi:hypothetical protein
MKWSKIISKLKILIIYHVLDKKLYFKQTKLFKLSLKLIKYFIQYFYTYRL